MLSERPKGCSWTWLVPLAAGPQETASIRRRDQPRAGDVRTLDKSLLMMYNLVGL
jgi:hypothetical protein